MWLIQRKNLKRGEVSYMNSRLSLMFKEEYMKGKKEAEEKAYKKNFIAKKMKKRGIPTEYIIEDTGLTVEEITE